MHYTPHFTITNNMVNLVAKITDQLTVRSFVGEYSPLLRKINRIKIIQDSSTLSTEEITAILEGKHVIASLREVQEIRNALCLQ